MMSQLRKKQARVVGFKETLKAIKAGQALKVYLAEDADQHIIEQIQEASEHQEIPLEMVERKTFLGQACGIDVGSATAALIDTSEFSK